MSLTLKKKLTTAIAGIVCVVLVQYIGLAEDAATTVSQMITGIISAYMVGQGMADFAKEKTAVVEVTQ